MEIEIKANKMFSFLKERASKYNPIYYSILYKQVGLDVNKESDLSLGSHLLEMVNEMSGREYMISSFAVAKAGNGPYEGFYRLAERWGRMPSGLSSLEKEKFWMEEMKRVYEKYRVER
jgi:hypothetical protein